MDISKLKTLKDFDVTGKKILLRVGYDFSLKEVNGKLVAPDHARIRATIPTIEYLLEKGCSIGLLSWLKRPAGKVDEKLRMKPVAEKLSEILGKSVEALSDCVGNEVENKIRSLQPGEIVMLENVRFHNEEETYTTEATRDELSEKFAKDLTAGFDCIVFDAFAQAHRKSASVVGICKYLPVVAGFLMQKELEYLSKITDNPERPFVAIIGGAKISDKVDLLKLFLNKADCLLIGGALANTFLKAQGIEVGKSLVDDPSVDAAKGDGFDSTVAAKEILEVGTGTLSLADAQVDKVQLPIDFVAALTPDSNETVVVNVDKGEIIPEGYSFLDIGPRTQDLYSRALKGARLIFANGPMGFFEKPAFEAGTKKVSQGIIESGAISILGGGDTESVIAKFSMQGKFTHVSTGGGSTLEYLVGKEFQVLKYLTK